MTQTATPFADLDAYVALPRVAGLTISPDGERVVVTVSELDEKKTAYVTSIWEVDPAGEAPARRLTRGASSESAPTFTADGDLLFVAERAHGAVSEQDATPALWALPRGGGEARVVASRPAGIAGARAARAADILLLQAEALGSATDEESERRLRDLRKDTKVNAILHSGYPIRYWDHDLGPGATHLFVTTYAAAEAEAAGAGGAEQPPVLRDLTPGIGAALNETDHDLSPDGTLVATQVQVPTRAGRRSVIEVIDVVTGDRRRVVDTPEADAHTPRFSPDGTRLAYLSSALGDPEHAPSVSLHVVGADGTRSRRLAPEWDRWPGSATWLPDGDLLVVADSDGRAPIFRVPGDGGDPVQLTGDAAAYSEVRVHGEVAYALRASYEFPAEPVRIDLATGEISALRGPVARPELPGVLREVSTTTADGARVRSWLALPAEADAENPAPLVLWIHGGPLGSWNSWSWRWCPWLLVAQGYAVLLPDPALSTGYGEEFIQRGWGAWGGAPYDDLMVATDAAEQLAEIDAERTAAMGGSFGGYMANWVAGHTDRFDAIVTHASLWALEGFGPTTDASHYWSREMTPEMALANSPHRFVGDIRTPMLVIHGDKDYRVPIGEGLRLWYELLSASGLPAAADGSTVHRFLYYPDENHWILTPQHAKVWYQVVLAYLGEHVLGEAATYPETLG